MKQLMFALVALILLAFAAPAIASDFQATDQIMAAVDMSADNVDLATTINTKIEAQNQTATVLTKDAPGLATLTDPTKAVVPCARSSDRGSSHLVSDTLTSTMRPNGDGGVLLRQGGQPAVS